MEIAGVVGHVKWHHYTAAAINGYTVTRSPEGAWRVTATVVMRDAFNLTQRPLTFEAPTKATIWRWPIRTFTLTEAGVFAASLGAPEP